MSFTVLSDSHVKQILGSLSPAEVSDLVDSLSNALVQYSCQDEKQYQPHRAVMARPDGQTTLFMPASTPDLVGFKIVGISPSKPATPAPAGIPPPALKSALTLCDETGQAIGVLNAAELTSFRTALGSMLLYRSRRNTENIVVFGAGKQALWHVRLAVLLRAKDIRTVTVVNRSAARTRQLVDTLTGGDGSAWPSHIKLNVFDEQGDRDAALEALLVDSDVVFCTTPSTQPLFPASFLTSENARAKTRFLSAIGSYRLDMQEIDPELLKLVVDPSSVFAGSAYQGGTIAVDSLEGCLQEAGELVKAELPTEKLLEIGRILDPKSTADQAELKKWLEHGLVIYKSVGVGVMDLAIGKALLHLATSRNVGVTSDEF
ncbi:hypothetical protein AK830_g7550 [Neonectria ditissima]|uniref:Quinate/shikimate 5-dehydrogenase/glutamyl-tRNA reductase domain-containing protein n=1 Tax=Neonectria ditissima TaxID=78410 RepID=A0A0P7BEY0_9HYPO|nr:hypothetical protein AK830_g7550 [Neonectria ditissima]